MVSRAPVNVNAASEEVITALLTGLQGFFLTDRSRQVQPYLQVGVGAYILGRDSWDYDTLTGVGFQLGGGVDIYLSPHVSIGGKLLYLGAHLDNSDVAWPSFPTESTWLSTLAYGGDLKFHF